MEKNLFTTLTLALAVAFTTSVVMAQNASPAAKYPGYKLVFQDEFDTGDRPNSRVWTYETGFKRNAENQYYQSENVTVKDGYLVIEGRKERKENPGYNKFSPNDPWKAKYIEYTSGSVVTRSSSGYAWGYGIYEVRAKIPCYTGCWPAIWTCGTAYEWPYNGEIDIMEYYPSSSREAIHANVAWGTSKRWNAAWSSKVKTLDTYADMELWKQQFHTWTMIYTEESIRLYCDNDLLNETKLDRTVNPRTEWHPYDNCNPYRDPSNKQYVMLNLALGGINGGSLDDTPFPCYYYVDYVRVYTPTGSSTDYVDAPVIDEPSVQQVPYSDNTSVRDVLMADAVAENVVAVYNLEGELVAKSIADARMLRRGVYLAVCDDGSSYKFKH